MLAFYPHGYIMLNGEWHLADEIFGGEKEEDESSVR